MASYVAAIFGRAVFASMCNTCIAHRLVFADFPANPWAALCQRFARNGVGRFAIFAECFGSMLSHLVLNTIDVCAVALKTAVTRLEKFAPEVAPRRHGPIPKAMGRGTGNSSSV
jgi:hypothetical protein